MAEKEVSKSYRITFYFMITLKIGGEQNVVCILKKIRIGVKKVMNEKITVCKEFLSSDQNRLIAGMVIMGAGVGLGIGLGGSLIASAFIHAPKH